MKRYLIYLTMMLALMMMAAQCGSAPTSEPTAPDSEAAAEDEELPIEAEITVIEPFARASMPNGAVYMELFNQTAQDDALISAETDVAETVELHETVIGEDEVMQMRPIERVELPGTGGSAVLQPGGIHIMLLGLKEDLARGDTFDLTLNFEQAPPMTIEVTVQEGMGMGNGHGHGMESDDMEADPAEEGHDGDMETDDMEAEHAEEGHDGDMETEHAEDMPSEN